MPPFTGSNYIRENRPDPIIELHKDDEVGLVFIMDHVLMKHK